MKLPCRWCSTGGIRAARVALAGLALLGSGLLAPSLEAGTELDHPAPESVPAAAIPPAPAAATDPLAIDPMELWMTNYHRNPAPEEIPARIGTLVGRGAFAAGSPRAREYVRFFSAALAAEPEAIPAVQRAAETAAGQEKAILTAVVAKAGH